MSVAFLDIDGVLKPWNGELCNDRIKLLQEIVVATGCKIVLSSKWRLNTDQMAIIKGRLLEHGVRLHGSTPVTPGKPNRGAEIQAWITANRRMSIVVKSFAILDDDPQNQVGVTLKPHLIKCDSYTGLTRELAEQAIQLLTHKPTP